MAKSNQARSTEKATAVGGSSRRRPGNYGGGANSDPAPPPPPVVEGIIPLYVSVDLADTEFRETFLWKQENREESASLPPLISRQLCREMGLPVSYERLIEAQIRAGLKKFAGKEDFGGEALVTLDLSVEFGNEIYKDKVQWDLNESQNSPEMFAWQVCEDLRLKVDFMEPIAVTVREQIEQHRQRLLKDWSAGLAMTGPSTSPRGMATCLSSPLPDAGRVERTLADREVWGPELWRME
ncbi:hypothetical protein CBR_g53839 [Chara braunii]|uniref:Uncharacterized protein n=1 Tax=Chara braunii TaxID=69332 RepID=A0A388K753_CHABU|nr:hypothetical protein CBR_g53839 [Chara braunii]|eukprot:GBG65866.1 hypothetical protein CBR_g53839 [Chara braunii]